MDASPLIFESAGSGFNPGLDEMDVFASHSGMQLVSGGSTSVLGRQPTSKPAMPATAGVQTPGSHSSSVSQLNPRTKQIGPEVEIFSSSLGAMVSLLAKLSSLLVSPEDQLPEPLKLHKDQLELLKEEVEGLNTFLINLSWVEAPNMMVKHWMNEVRDLSYDIEDYIDKTMHSGPNWHFDSEVEELSTLMKQAKDAHERYNRYDLGCWASRPRFMVDEQGQVPVPRLNGEFTILVGISDSKTELIKRLNNGAEQRQVVCIQGYQGVGKTTLAKEVYYEMEGQFECRAFVRASKMPDTRRLLSGIISQIKHHRRGPPPGQPVQELIDSLRKHLQQKRYLIVIDGLWETTSWDIVSSAFPDNGQCSRILLTTDSEEVALECCDYESDAIFKMEPLGGNDSTELFFNRVFGFKHDCSKQLKESSEEIIRTCGGLPLAIISIASILAIQPDNLELWRHVKEALFSRLRYNPTFEVMLREIVGLSYSILPHHLKTCLLYLSMYPEGYTFLKADLVKQWSAEGFIIAVEEKNCDEVAECYFDELICRGLIQPNHTNISGEVILYTLHSTLFEVIRTMSNEENFSTVIDYSNTISKLYVKVRRLSLRFSSAKYATKPESIRLSPVRSLIFYGLVNCLPSFMEFEVLRVLILEVWGDQEELDLSGIDRLFQLRYIHITSNIIVKLPAQMIGLPYLQTMEIYASVTSVPSDIVHLPRLLHLCVCGEINLSSGIDQMRSLRTLQSFDLSSNSEDTIWELGEMTGLRDLHVTSTTEMSYLAEGKLTTFVSSLEKLTNLKSIILAPVPLCTSISLDCSWSISSLSVFLQRLELLPPICIFSRLPVWIGQLRKLFILKIVLMELTAGDVDIMAKLQQLTILSLYVRQPTSELIVFHHAAFPVLKCFKFRCGIMHIAFQPNAMPSLRRLKLEFNAHSGEQNGNMLAGVEHLLNLQEITGRIGSAPGAEEADRMAAELLFKVAISKHSRLTNFNLQIVRPFDEEISRFADTTASCSGSDEFNGHSMDDGISAITEVACVPEVSPLDNCNNASSQQSVARKRGEEWGAASGSGSKRVRGSQSKTPLAKNWWERMSSPDCPEDEFQRAFHMSRATFDAICKELGDFVAKRDTDTMLNDAAIPMRQRVAICIWHLATGEPLRLVSKRFSVGISTCHKLVLEVCASIKSVLMSKVMQWPEAPEASRDVSAKFEAVSGIPNVVGVMYTTHIPIIAPKANATAYYNRRLTERNQKASYSITVQGVVDAAGAFTDVCIGWPGSMSDADVLDRSALCAQRGAAGQLQGQWVVGGADYPLMDWLLVPYTNVNMTWAQHVFNERLGGLCAVARDAFQRLKTRWGCLQKRTEVKLQDLPIVIGACCVLHNICERADDAADLQFVFKIFDDDMVAENPVRSMAASSARDAIAHDLLHRRSNKSSVWVPSSS